MELNVIREQGALLQLNISEGNAIELKESITKLIPYIESNKHIGFSNPKRIKSAEKDALFNFVDIVEAALLELKKVRK